MIDSFSKENSFLSNFATSIIYGEDGIVYPTVEHYFQAHKTIDLKIRQQIANCSSPGKAKRLGRQIKLREDWEEIKELVMINALRKKFLKEDFRNNLLNTKDEELIEGNYWHDNYWGSCYCSRCKNSGKNQLGKILMQIREEMRKENVI